MYLSHLRIIATVCIIHHLVLTCASDSPVQNYQVDDIAVNCGSSGTSSAFDGREWIGDMDSKFTSPKGKSISSSTTIHQSIFVDPVPYMSAWISRDQFTYTFQLRPGQKFIRLHFYPVSYPGFERSKALFTVKAGPYTLLSNFSTSLTADALGVSYFAKEFCVNIQENQVFNITFFPSKSSSPSYADDDVYAFINGIEIVSMPTGLYYTPYGDLGAHIVGNQFFRSYIDNVTALEMFHRLNVGGRSILSVEDLGMFRMWSEDKNYLLQSSFSRVSTNNMITYNTIPAYSAPLKVYQTAWSISSNQMYNFTWKLPVDLGFRYLIRLHFCELEPIITESGEKKFDLLINNKFIETDADVIKWSGGNGAAVYRDYVIMMEGDPMECRSDLIITLKFKYVSSTKKIDAILKGIEIFKLSNPDNNLAAGVNPVFTTHAPISGIPRLRKLVLAFGSINTIATGTILVLTLLYFIFYHLNHLESNSWKKKVSSSLDEEGLHRRFSLVEIHLATNNFDDGLVIGKGGFGKVYKGLLDRTKSVAIKRLNSQSKQGAHEFWAEIDALSKLRHVHLVSLIGYCDDCEEMILVYEYMAHGTLADHLHKASRDGSGNSPLSWEERLNICIGAARGLEFLHTSSGAHHGIIHRDVKSSNILLNENWEAKISDFGLSKLDTANISRTHISTNVKGTIGYLDPEYFMTQRITKKTDVYAFGVVLFEVLCGRQAVDLTLEEEQRSLALWARKCIRNGTLDQFIDSSVKEQISLHCFKGFAKIANKCLHERPNERPTMAEIVAGLELITLEQEVMSVGETGNEHTEWSIKSKDSPPMSGHYSLPPMEVKNGGMLVDSILPGRNTGPSWVSRLWGLLWRRTRPSKKQPSKKQAWLLETGSSGLIEDLTMRSYSYNELQKATNSFREKLGRGAFGTVYRGALYKGKKLIAVKKLEMAVAEGEMEFRAEMRALGRTHHKNLVRLLGYCAEGSNRLLVYEFMSNGSLANLLFRAQQRPDWGSRVRIALDVARGILYLHEECEAPTLHCDIKPQNILMDDSWTAKISDFGISKLLKPDQTMTFTGIRGTKGYVAPEWFMNKPITVKVDIYSYGILLLEIVCCRRNIEVNVSEEEVVLCDWVYKCFVASELNKLVGSEEVDKKILEDMVKVGLWCIQAEPAFRPSMKKVVLMLEGICEIPIPPCSFNSFT